MQPPLPDSWDGSDGATEQEAECASSEPADAAAMDAFLKTVLRLIERDKARKRPLPRSAKFASKFQQGVVDMNDRDAIKSRAIGTELTPDQDVIAMDTSVPRAPDESTEAELEV